MARLGQLSNYWTRLWLGGVSTLVVLFLSFTPSPVLAYSCSITATIVAFGNVDVSTGAAVDSTATLTLNCTGAPSNKWVRNCVSIDGGSAWDATSRLMNGPSSPQLRFQLYSDAARTTAWGSWPASLYGGGFTWDVFSTAANLTATTTVYGRVPGSQQSIPSGSYSSNLTLFFTYDNSDNTACPFNGKGNSSTTFTATATVLSNCIVSATNLNFGSTGTLSSNIDATSSLSIQCSNGAPYNVGLDAGTGSGATVATRKMTSGGNTVNYTMYQNAGRTTLWGTTIGTNTLSGTGSGSAQNLTVYGRVPTQTTPAPGTYADTIVVTVTY